MTTKEEDIVGNKRWLRVSIRVSVYLEGRKEGRR